MKSSGQAEKDEGQPRPPAVDDGIFENDDQAAKHCSSSLSVLRTGHRYQKFDQKFTTTFFIPRVFGS